MLKLRNGRNESPYYPESEEPAAKEFDLSQILGTVQKQWPIIAAVVIFCLLIAVSYVLTATPLYSASTRILIDPRKNQLLQSQQVVSDQTIDASVVDSQVEIIKSESVALTVVRELNLTKDPSFGSKPSIFSSLFSSVFSLLDSLSSSGAEVESGADKNSSQERAAANIVATNIVAKRVGLTLVIEVTYTASTPYLAERVANGVADAYMVGELEAKFQATKRASKWLQDRIGELRGEATTADRAVQTFKSANNIVNTSRGLMSEQQLSDVNAQLISAKATTAEAKARLDRITEVLNVSNGSAVPDATVSDALHSDIINRLRAQYLDMSGREADWSARYGVNHSAAVNLRNQMAETRRSIANEMTRIASTYRNDYEIAQSREKSLSDSLDALVAQDSNGGQARVKLLDLESSAQTSRTLYDSFLQKYMEATQQQTFPTVEARVITPASKGTKSSPKSLLILGGALVFGLFSGVGAAVARESLNRSFLTGADVMNVTGYECLGILQTVVAPVAGNDPSAKAAAMCSFAIQSPFSRFTETLRSVKVSIDLARLTREMKVIGIVSSTPREGKTTVASNLAQLTANTGHKTLLIDGDLRNPTLTKLMGRDAKVGLFDVLAKGRTIADVVLTDPTTGLDIIPSIFAARVSDAAELLSSDAMSKLLAMARSQYEYVFIDFAPVGPVVDVKAASHLADGFVYVVEWGKTTHQSVKEAIASADQMRQRMLGIVLNHADSTQLKRRERYQGKDYQRYYADGEVDA